MAKRTVEFPEECLNKIVERAIEHVVDTVMLMPEYNEEMDCGSIIEDVVAVALRAEIEFGHSTHTSIYFASPGQLKTIDDYEKFEQYTDIWKYVSGAHVLFVETQVQIDDWRVDFLVSTAEHETRCINKLIVECDGHDFHERTKFQAARDRARDRNFQAKGYTVFIFTGSEIWKDPGGCAKQIVEWADDALYHRNVNVSNR